MAAPVNRSAAASAPTSLETAPANLIDAAARRIKPDCRFCSDTPFPGKGGIRSCLPDANDLPANLQKGAIEITILRAYFLENGMIVEAYDGNNDLLLGGRFKEYIV